MKQRIFFYLVWLCGHVSLGQSLKTISGRIVEKGTRVGISFANVVVTHSSTGSISNPGGNFHIDIGRELLGEKLRISGVGYKSKELSIDSLLHGTTLTIELTPSFALIKDSRRVDPTGVLKKALAAVSENYYAEPFNVEYYSELVATGATPEDTYRLETILLGYSRGYGAMKRKKFEISQKRTSGRDPLRAIRYPYLPTWEIHNGDILSNEFHMGVLYTGHLDKFSLKYKGMAACKGDTLYIIEYHAPNPTREVTGFGVVPRTYKGVLAIAVRSHAIVMHELMTDQFSFMVSYGKVKGKYFPVEFHGERTTPDTRAIGRVQNAIRLIRVKTDNVIALDSKTNEFQDDLESIDYNEDFWNTYYPVAK